MRIGSTPSGTTLTALHYLQLSNALRASSAEHLASQRCILRGGDDPAGLIAAETLSSELASVNAAQSNAARVVGAIRVADSGMAEVGHLLNSIRGHVVEASGGFLSDAEVAAKQIEIDAAVEAVNRISRYTTFGGRRLLDGSAEGLVLNLSPKPGETSVLNLPNVHASRLGDDVAPLNEISSSGNLNLSHGNLSTAVRVLDAARDEILGARAGTGAFEAHSIESGRRVLDALEEQLTEGVSRLLDADMAEASSRMIRAEMLVEAGLAMVWTSAQSPGVIGALLA